MLDEATILAVTRHGMAHEIAYCNCPCFAALMAVGKAMKVEAGLRERLAEVSPEALAAITLAGRPAEEERG